MACETDTIRKCPASAPVWLGSWAVLAVVLLTACSDSRSDKLVTLCMEDVARTKAECECQAKVIRAEMSEEALDMILRLGSVKTPDERMTIMREAGRDEKQFTAWGQSFQEAVEKSDHECRIGQSAS